MHDSVNGSHDIGRKTYLVRRGAGCANPRRGVVQAQDTVLVDVLEDGEAVQRASHAWGDIPCVGMVQ